MACLFAKCAFVFLAATITDRCFQGVSAATSFMCYSCAYGYSPDADESCVTGPPSAEPTHVTGCRNNTDNACVTSRQWNNALGLVWSFWRGCESQGVDTDHCYDDDVYTTCVTYCQGDLCNDGDGVLDDTSGAICRMTTTRSCKITVATLSVVATTLGTYISLL